MPKTCKISQKHVTKWQTLAETDISLDKMCKQLAFATFNCFNPVVNELKYYILTHSAKQPLVILHCAFLYSFQGTHEIIVQGQ